MNLFAINAAEINGSNVVWSWYGSSEVAIQASGDGYRGAPLSGASNIVVQTSGDPAVRMFPSFQAANIVFSASGDALYGRSGSGTSTIQLSTTLNGTRWVLGESASDIVFEADGDAQVVAPAAATFTLVLASSIEERVTPAVMGIGASVIQIEAYGVGIPGKAVALDPIAAQIEFASRGIPHLVIDSPDGSSEIVFHAQGESRIGGMVRIDPAEAVISLFSRGDSSLRHYVFAEGEARITLMTAMLQAGIPPIPSEYVPAPRARTVIVQRDARDMTVAHENRSL